VAEKILTARASGSDVRFWHALGTLLVLLQWLGALGTLWWLAGRINPQSVTSRLAVPE